MNLAQALDEHEQEIGARSGRRASLSPSPLDLLREYLIGYAEITETEALSQSDLEDFFARWYLSNEAADPEGALELIAAVERWSAWLDRRESGGLEDRFRPLAARLREDLPRAIRALRLLRAHVHRDDYGGIPAQTSAGGEVFLISSGLSRVIRPFEVDYGRAEEDYFRVEAIDGLQVTVQSRSGAQMGRAPLGPVHLPPEVVVLLRVGDTLHAEIAPAGAGWEVLEASGLFPGGYDGVTI